MKNPISISYLRNKFLEGIITRLCKYLPASDIGRLFERVQIDFAGEDPRIGAYALEYNNPQALCFLIDAYPTLRRLFNEYPRMSDIRLIDIGPAFGAAGGLLAQMHRSHFLGPKLRVDALDIVADRKNFIEMSYPMISFLHSRIEDISPDKTWDIAYCSNVIEHLDNPQNFLRLLLERIHGYAVLLAPYMEEKPLSLDHKVRINEATFEGFPIISFEKLTTPAWPPTADGVARQQALIVLRGTARSKV